MNNSDVVDGGGERGIGISSNVKGKGKVSMGVEVGKEVGTMCVVPSPPTGNQLHGLPRYQNAPIRTKFQSKSLFSWSYSLFDHAQHTDT